MAAQRNLKLSQAHQLCSQKEFSQALALYDELLDTNGMDHEAAHGAAIASMNSRKFEKAKAYLLRAIEIQPQNKDYLFNLGYLFKLMQEIDLSIDAFKSAIEVAPDFGSAYYELSTAYSSSGMFKQAIECAIQGIDVDPKNLVLYSSLVMPLKMLDRIDEAIEYVEQGLTFDENSVRLLTDLAGLYFESGDRAEARKKFEQILLLAPNNANAHRMVSLSKKYEEGEPQIEQMERVLLLSQLRPKGAMNVHFGLGKAYEDLQNYEGSFKHYKKANDIFRSFFQYPFDVDEKLFSQTKQAYFVDDGVCSLVSDITPIFIVGMPRSGTSLVEQILASKECVFGAGELDGIQNIQLSLFDRTKEVYVENVKKLSSEDLTCFAEKYLNSVSNQIGDRTCFTDKMPYNFLYIGLIKRIFPEARIIHCCRDSRDVCLSIYKNYFSYGTFYGYNLHELGTYWRRYDDLMAFWHELYPEQILDVVYEDVIEDQETQTRRILEYCGLDWDENCLEFYKTNRPVMTASALQVKQPIYNSSVGAWKNYAPYIGELLDALK